MGLWAPAMPGYIKEEGQQIVTYRSQDGLHDIVLVWEGDIAGNFQRIEQGIREGDMLLWCNGNVEDLGRGRQAFLSLLGNTRTDEVTEFRYNVVLNDLTRDGTTLVGLLRVRREDDGLFESGKKVLMKLIDHIEMATPSQLQAHREQAEAARKQRLAARQKGRSNEEKRIMAELGDKAFIKKTSESSSDASGSWYFYSDERWELCGSGRMRYHYSSRSSVGINQRSNDRGYQHGHEVGSYSGHNKDDFGGEWDITVKGDRATLVVYPDHAPEATYEVYFANGAVYIGGQKYWTLGLGHEEGPECH